MKPAEIAALLRLEVALDLRQRAAWAGMLLYVVSAVYVAYLAVKGGLGTATWNALFWIILLFAAFNALIAINGSGSASTETPSSFLIAGWVYLSSFG